jgi:sensor domain CHASE-containing protein
VSPTKVNPHVHKNLMLAGQNLTASTQVKVGGYAAATVEAPDAYHLLVKLPEDLPQGTYLVVATNEAGTTTAEEPVVVQAESGTNRMTILYGGGFMALLMLVARAARPRVLR